MKKTRKPQTFALRQYKNGEWRNIEDVITTEIPVNLQWSAKEFAECTATIWTWPEFLEEVAVGHILLEKLQNKLDIFRERKISVECIENDKERLVKVRFLEESTILHKTDTQKITAQGLLQAMDSFIDEEGLWDSTGCFHKAGVYCLDSKQLLHKVEDIARHNCIDRLAGWAALNGIFLGNKALLVSARLTRSLCLKALRAGFPLLVSRSAVTTAAVELAKAANATLVGFARTKEQRFTVFIDSQNTLL